MAVLVFCTCTLLCSETGAWGLSLVSLWSSVGWLWMTYMHFASSVLHNNNNNNYSQKCGGEEINLRCLFSGSQWASGMVLGSKVLGSLGARWLHPYLPCKKGTKQFAQQLTQDTEDPAQSESNCGSESACTGVSRLPERDPQGASQVQVVSFCILAGEGQGPPRGGAGACITQLGVPFAPSWRVYD